ncbi:MAG: AAA domain-containing protein [Candidatus Eisenbacteria bacterium]|nr:AAA domain-containing protein [Candidatus Eisenbacteria bacterium]
MEGGKELSSMANAPRKRTAKKTPSKRSAAKTPRKRSTGKAPRKRSATGKPSAKRAAKPGGAKGKPWTKKARQTRPPKHSRKSAAKAARNDAGRAQAPPAAGQSGVSSREAEILLNLESLLGRRIVGKEDAVGRVANVIRTRRTQLDFHPDRPDGSFLLVGPAGVGKNEFAYAVAEILLGNENQVVSLDMGDYQDEESVQKLIASPVPGREDLIMVGTLTSAVRTNPRVVVLLRGIEKAHANVQRLVYQILEEGRFSDAAGAVSFQQTIVFATTRYSKEELRPGVGIGFAHAADTLEDRLTQLLKQTIYPELVGAFNEVIFVGSLTPDDVRKIARYKVEVVLNRLRRQRRAVKVSDRVLETFIRADEIQRTGASRLNRTLEERLFQPLALYLLENRKARQIQVDLKDDNLIIH